MKKYVFAFAVLALAAASAADRYTVKFFLPAEVAGQLVKAGEYSLELKGDRAILKGASGKVESEARIESGDRKFPRTVVRYTGTEPNARLDEIRIGGTSTTVVFAKPQLAGN